MKMRATTAIPFALVMLGAIACDMGTGPRPSGTTSSSGSSSSGTAGDGGMAGQGGNGGEGGEGGEGGGGGMLPAPYCGDYVVNLDEECDDGNNDAGDGCSSDCHIESGEAEPNDTAAQASPYVANPYYLAKIDPGADVDFVSFSVTTPNTSVVATILDVGDGACSIGNIDSMLDILAADGTTVIASDDDGGEQLCSRVEVPSLAIGNYFVRVSAAVKAGTPSFIYRLRIDQVEDICGDGTVTTGEECDDGNTLPGDGCSATCKIEISEVEPNGTTATANPFVQPWNAVLTPLGDVDVVAVNVIAPVSTFTAATTDQGTGACAAKTLDTIVEILAPDGTTVLAMGDDNVGNCGSTLVTNVAAGTYFVRVKGGSLVTDPSPYGLQILLQ